MRAGRLLSRLGAAGEEDLAERHKLTTGEQPMRVDVGGQAARLAGRFGQCDAGVDVAEIGSSLSDALVVRGNRVNGNCYPRASGDPAFGVGRGGEKTGSPLARG